MDWLEEPENKYTHRANDASEHEPSDVGEIHCVLPNVMLHRMPRAGIVDDTIPTWREYRALVGPVRRRN